MLSELSSWRQVLSAQRQLAVDVRSSGTETRSQAHDSKRSLQSQFSLMVPAMFPRQHLFFSPTNPATSQSTSPLALAQIKSLKQIMIVTNQPGPPALPETLDPLHPPDPRLLEAPIPTRAMAPQPPLMVRPQMASYSWRSRCSPCSELAFE